MLVAKTELANGQTIYTICVDEKAQLYETISIDSSGNEVITQSLAYDDAIQAHCSVVMMLKGEE